MADTLILIVPFIFGTIVGSFLNVCIYRIPLGLSIVTPGSSCPACKTPVPFYLNIPVLSYFILRGRCASCKTPLSIRYPVIESLAGAFAAVLFYRYGTALEFFIYFAFVSSLIVVTFIDIDHGIIPDVISLPGIAAGIIASFFLSSPGVAGSVIGTALGAGVLLAIAIAYYWATGSEGMGGGDIKLLGMIGAFLGWKGVILTLLLGSLLGSLIGVIVIAASGKGSKFPIPFGPFLATGAVSYLFFGETLIGWYVTRALSA